MPIPLYRRQLLLSASFASLGASLGARAASAGSDDLGESAIDAYIYGYSLITTEVMRVQLSNVRRREGLRAPTNQFANLKRFPPADFRGYSAPNADLLYSLAWLDVGPEPVVFSHPDMGQRYFLFPLYSLWMELIEALGSRTTGGKAASYLITGPDWTGNGPEGLPEIPCPTRYVAIVGRTWADGTEPDREAVNKLQAQFSLVPLSAYGRPYLPPAISPIDANPIVGMTDNPQRAIEAMSPQLYFGTMARLMGGAAPPASEDASTVERLARLGVAPGAAFDMTRLEPPVRAALKDAGAKAHARLATQRTEMGVKQNGWIIPPAAGHYGTDYVTRALIAAYTWPGNLPEDAVYPYATKDGAGQKLSGANRYTLTFAKGQTPPVAGYWSVTLYTIDGGWWFYPNPLNKFSVGPRDNPAIHADGSLTLYLQADSPGKEKEANWLPAPRGDFALMMRLYWPRPEPPSILPLGHGTWQPPAVTKVG
jgi:hypothetical protein